MISLFLTAVEGSFFPELVFKYFGFYRLILVDVKDQVQRTSDRGKNDAKKILLEDISVRLKNIVFLKFI